MQVISKALLGNWPFREIVGERTGIPRKPDPTALLAIAASLEVRPGECLMVGDSEIDVATARAASLPVIGVTFGYTPEPVATFAPDAVIEGYGEFPQALAGVLRA